MEHYKFTQAVIIAGKTFGLGIQQVPAEIEQHPHFLRYAECGWIHEADPSELVPKTEVTRKTNLAEKLRTKNKTEHVQEPVRGGGLADGDPKVTKLQPNVGAEQVPGGVQVDHVSIDPTDDELKDTVDEGDLTPQQKAARTRARNTAAKQKEQ